MTRARNCSSVWNSECYGSKGSKAFLDSSFGFLSERMSRVLKHSLIRIFLYKLIVRNLASTYSAHATSRRGVHVGETGGNYAHAHEQYFCLQTPLMSRSCSSISTGAWTDVFGTQRVVKFLSPRLSSPVDFSWCAHSTLSSASRHIMVRWFQIHKIQHCY